MYRKNSRTVTKKQESAGGFIPNSFQTPNAFIDDYMSYLTPEEFKLLIYATRRIFGFQKRQDRISLSQFETGITAKDGTILDHGTGLSRNAIRRALAGLLETGLLVKLEEARADRTAAMYALQLNPERVNIQFMIDRRTRFDLQDKARLKKARAAKEQVPPTEPTINREIQGKQQDPVVVFFASLQRQDKIFVKAMKAIAFPDTFTVKQIDHFLQRAHRYGEDKTLAYLEWCQRQGHSWEKAYHIDAKHNKVENWVIEEEKKEPEPLTYEIDWGRLVVIWSDGIEEPIDNDGYMSLRGKGGYSSPLLVCPKLGEVEYREKNGAIRRIERTKDNRLIVRDVREGDTDRLKIYQGGEWIRNEEAYRKFSEQHAAVKARLDEISRKRREEMEKKHSPTAEDLGWTRA